jgi:hypothetical protein
MISIVDEDGLSHEIRVYVRLFFAYRTIIDNEGAFGFYSQ